MSFSLGAEMLLYISVCCTKRAVSFDVGVTYGYDVLPTLALVL